MKQSPPTPPIHIYTFFQLKEFYFNLVPLPSIAECLALKKPTKTTVSHQVPQGFLIANQAKIIGCVMEQSLYQLSLIKSEDLHMMAKKESEKNIVLYVSTIKPV